MNCDRIAKDFRLAFQSGVTIPDGTRPFVCEGSPYEQKAFLIGINATVGIADFWNLWDDPYGMRKREKFSPAYLTERGGKASKTRQRIDDLVQNVRCLETNIYIQPTRRAHHVTDKGTEVIQFLLTHLKPKVVLTHGKAPARYIFDHHVAENNTVVSEQCKSKFTLVPTDWGDAVIKTVPHLWLPCWNTGEFDILKEEFRAAIREQA